VVVLADALFRWPDFRAPERAFQVLQQVAGRAGRGEKPGKVLVQTYDPEHVVIRTLQGQLGEEEFLEGERELRQVLGYPPFGRLARIRFESADREEVQRRAQLVANGLAKFAEPGGPFGEVEILGPSEAFLERAKGIYRWDILIKSRDVQGLQKALATAREACFKQKWNFLVDVDPYGVG